MSGINVTKCANYGVFYQKLKEINEFSKTHKKLESSAKISEFLDKNAVFLDKQNDAVFLLDSLASNLRHLGSGSQLIEKLKNQVEKILPADPEGARVSLLFIRSTIKDPTERVRAIADWIDLMKIPLAQLELENEELFELLTRLEYVDLTDFNFLDIDGVKLTNHLFQSDLQFNTKQVGSLTKIASFCAQHDIERTVKNFKCFGICDEQVRIQLAKQWAQRSGWHISENMRNFEIGEEKVRIEIAKLCAQQHGGGATRYIRNFEIDDEQARIEIAMLCAEFNGSQMGYYIKNFSISCEQVRFEIAKLCAKHDSSCTAGNIENFGITNKQMLIEIAKLCAQNSGGSTAQNIGKFCIEDEEVRITIAKLCAQHNAHGTVSFFQNFEISDEGARVEIAKLCAQRDGSSTAYHISNFKIGDENARVEIAKLCVQQDILLTAEYFVFLEIENEQGLFEIAKLCALKDGEVTAKCFKVFPFNLSNSDRYQIFLECIQSNPKALFHILRS